MASIEGVDYSRTSNANWAALAGALNANGKHFVGRYAVADKSPGERGITATEYQAMKEAGIEVFLYYEEDEAWMLGGWDAGVRAGNRALAVIRECGMPVTMPVYYSHDIEPESQHYAAIDQCLRGAASVVGANAVGVYGGYWLVEHCAAVGSAKWFCQTWAWSGNGGAWERNISSHAHLYQYETRNLGAATTIAGTNVDFVRALKAHYGQASDFLVKPTPVYAKRTKIDGPIEDKIVNGRLYVAVNPRRVTLVSDAIQFADPDLEQRASKTVLPKGKTVTVPYLTASKHGKLVRASVNGTHIEAGEFVEEVAA